MTCGSRASTPPPPTPRSASHREQTGQITLTFTPSGHRGQVVRGFIDVDTFNLASLSGDKVTTIPYEYKIR